MSTPISNPNKLSGAYQCCMCGKSIDQSPMIEFIVNCGRNRKTRVWACVEHILGVGALSCQAIADNMRSSDYHKSIDERNRRGRSASIAASRFKSEEAGDSRFKNLHNFNPVKNDGVATVKNDTVKAKKADNGSYVLCNTLMSKLGIPKESIASLVEKMNITVMTHNGNPAIKNDDFLSLSNEVRRMAIANRRGIVGVSDGPGGIENQDGSIEDPDDHEMAEDSNDN